MVAGVEQSIKKCLTKTFTSIAGVYMPNDTKKLPKRSFVMVTFGRGTAELKRQFDQIVEDEGYTNAGLALDLIREGISARRSLKRKSPKHA